MEKINNKEKKMILVNRENFKTSITDILRNIMLFQQLL